jgi:hypothetical protein
MKPDEKTRDRFEMLTGDISEAAPVSIEAVGTGSGICGRKSIFPMTHYPA